VANEIVIKAMIKGLRPGPTAQYFTKKPPQTLEKLLQKMDEYIRADNDFQQRREEAYRFSEITRGFGGRIHTRHVRSIHSSSQNDEKGSQLQRPTHFTVFRTAAKFLQATSSKGQRRQGLRRKIWGSSRKIYCLFCGEDKGHTTRTCQITILKQKEIAEAEARQNQPKQVLHTASCHSQGDQNMWATNLQLLLLRQAIHRLLGPSSHRHHYCNLLIPEASSQKGASTPNNNVNSGRNPKLVQSIVLYQNRSTYTERYPASEILLCSMPFCFLIRNKQCKFSLNFL
jgi:hypothetical protein